MNEMIDTIIVAPMTSRIRNYPSRVNCVFQDKEGEIVLDQIRTVDKSRLVKRVGKIGAHTRLKILVVLAEMFTR